MGGCGGGCRAGRGRVRRKGGPPPPPPPPARAKTAASIAAAGSHPGELRAANGLLPTRWRGPSAPHRGHGSPRRGQHWSRRALRFRTRTRVHGGRGPPDDLAWQSLDMRSVLAWTGLPTSSWRLISSLTLVLQDCRLAVPNVGRVHFCLLRRIMLANEALVNVPVGVLGHCVIHCQRKQSRSPALIGLAWSILFISYVKMHFLYVLLNVKFPIYRHEPYVCAITREIFYSKDPCPCYVLARHPALPCQPTH